MKPDEVALWMAHHVTRAYFEALWKEVDSCKETLGDGGTLFLGDANHTHAATADMVGYLRGLSFSGNIVKHMVEQ